MTAEGPGGDWLAAAADYLLASLPRWEDGSLNDMFMGPYQDACGVLSRLGLVEEIFGGATVVARDIRAGVRVRWDDVCCVVLAVAEQRGDLAFTLSDASGLIPVRIVRGGPGHPTVSAPAYTPPVPPGEGPTFVTPKGNAILTALGLLQGDRWSKRAAPVLLRAGSPAWSRDWAGDPLLEEAASHAVLTVPDDIRAELSAARQITDADIDAEISRRADAAAETAARMTEIRPGYQPPASPSRDDMRRYLERTVPDRLDAVFARRWRRPEGWLTPEQAEQALIFLLDPFAQALRQKVVDRLFAEA